MFNICSFQTQTKLRIYQQKYYTQNKLKAVDNLLISKHRQTEKNDINK